MNDFTFDQSTINFHEKFKIIIVLLYNGPLTVMQQRKSLVDVRYKKRKQKGHHSFPQNVEIKIFQ